MSHVSSLLSPLSCLFSPVSSLLSLFSCLLSPVSSLLSSVSFLLSPVSFLLCPVSPLLSPLSSPDSSFLPLSQSREVARKLVELGHKGNVLSREQFEEKKVAAQAGEAARSDPSYGRSRPTCRAATAVHPQQRWTKRDMNSCLYVVFSRTLASAGKELKDNFLRALAEREEANRSGKMSVSTLLHHSNCYVMGFPSNISSVIFIRDHNPLGREVSGYIDYAHRLKTQDFEPYFSGKKKLVPRRSDLCYYNWKTQVSTSNSSPNFEVIYDDPNGLLFKNKMDKKILNVDPLMPGNDSNRTILRSDLYTHAVIYDHSIRTV
uniref:Cilia- and flagella-associated protein 299 n=1 Tax=Cyclopterus lumpus TaxID=8103 RepID=A0A8C2XU89_CYCLU